MADDERSMRDIMEEVYDRMTADDPDTDTTTTSGIVFTGVEPDQEALDREARLKTMGEVWDKYNGPEAEKWKNAEAPSGWSEDARQKFLALSPDIKKMVLTEWDSRSIPERTPTEHWSQYLENVGVSRDEAFEYLMQLEQTLRLGNPEQKRQLVWNLLSDYQVELLDNNTPYRDPVNAYLMAQNKALSDRWTNFENELEVLAVHAAEQQVRDFKNTLENGQLKYPRFQECCSDIAEALRSREALSLEEAYRLALRKRGALQK